MPARAILLAAALAACGPTTPPVNEPVPAQPVCIVATERGPRGGRLIIIGEDGDRIDELTTVAPGVPALRDTGAVFSPDGGWVVFASSRGRAQLGESSLWVIAAQAGARPRRLTHADSTDLDPVFTRDGKHLVYASIERSGNNLDLWRVGIDVDAPGGPAVRGAPERLTETPENELHPSAGPGDAIAYTLASDRGSSIWVLDGGARRQLTTGSGDVTPAWSPDGTQIAFASGRTIDLGPRLRAWVHTDLFIVDAAGGQPRLVIDDPRADQVSPRWSRDGRWLFATSVVRAFESDTALLASVVFVDLRERPMTMRALYYPGGEDQRNSPALAGCVLDSAALHRNPPYEKAVCEALTEQLQRRMWEQICEQNRAKDKTFVCPPFEALPDWPDVCNSSGK